VPNREKDNQWLEPVLRKGLTRVHAPAELWDRVVLPRMDSRRSATPPRLVWMLAVASVVTASVCAVAVAWGHYPNPAGLNGLERPVEFRSQRASDVRGWVRQRTGLDIPLLAHPSSTVEMIGASVAETGRVEIRYRVANQVASLFVSASGGGLSEHKHVIRGSMDNVTTLSWNIGPQAYTLAVQRTGSLSGACLVCHTTESIL
jgi:hypothetical protein